MNDMKTNTHSLLYAVGLLAAFVGWTLAVSTIDVAAIGPHGSTVGFATLNRFVHDITGVHLTLYTITDWLGLVPIGVVAGFALRGLAQWVTRRRLRAVDTELLILGGFYLAVVAIYALFETVIVNYRPILINGCLEASYPSSTTMLVLCVMPTAAMQLRIHAHRRREAILRAAIAAFTLFMVIGRLVSGVHWLSDIVGGALLSAGLVMLYRAAVERVHTT
jgi:undecaprenyl-diphosphatase